MKSTALLLSLSLFAIPACSKKKDKAEAPPTTTKTVEAPSAIGAAPAAAKVNAKLEALAEKYDGLQDRLDELDYKTKAFEKEVVAAYGAVTTTLKGEETRKVWLDCDGSRCVGAILTLDEDPSEVYSFDMIDENKGDGYYYGFAYLNWRLANPDAKTKTSMTPAALLALGEKMGESDELLYSDALKQLAPAGKGVKYPEDEDYVYYHALDDKDCVVVGFMKYEDGEKGPEIDGLDIQEFEAPEDPLDDYDYGRCATYALGI